MNSGHAPSLLRLIDQRRRWVRILSILEACHWVGLTPIMANSLHVIAYLSEVLAPIWKLQPMDGKVLKQTTAPYYPILQQDIDRLIGMGLIRVDELQVTRVNDRSSVLMLKLSLESERVNPILTELRELPGEKTVLDFLREVVQAFSRLPDEQVFYSMNEDATYGNHAVDTGQVIDLGEWLRSEETPTSQAANQIRKLSGDGMNPAEIIDVYVNYIASRVNHG